MGLLLVSGLVGAATSSEDTSSQLQYMRPAPQDVIDSAKNEIVSNIGQSEFNSKFILNESYGLSDGTSVLGYSVIYNYQLPSSITNQEYVIATVRFDSDKNIISYEGPKKAHNFTITMDKAVQIANQNGVATSDARIMYVKSVYANVGGTAVQDSGLPPPTGSGGTDVEDYVWVASAAQDFGFKTIYLDVDTGEVVAASVDSGVRGAERTETSDNTGSANEEDRIYGTGSGSGLTKGGGNLTLYSIVILLIGLIVASFIVLKRKNKIN